MLEDTLLSLVKQTRIPEEVIVVDNGSSDNTKEIAANFSGKLNIKYILEREKGVPAARNTGIKSSSGDIIAFIDDDCLADKEWLHYLELPFLKDPSIGMVGGERLAYRTTGTLVEEYCIADASMRVGLSPKEKSLS